MDKFLIEVEHEAETLACLRVIRTFPETGSHYLTNAAWGCGDGEHKAWLIVEAESKEEARWIVPPPFRDEARIVKLSQFSMDQVERMMAEHL